MWSVLSFSPMWSTARTVGDFWLMQRVEHVSLLLVHDVTQCSDWLALWHYDSRYSSSWLRRWERGSDTVQIRADESHRRWVSEPLCYRTVRNPTKKWRGFNDTEFRPQLIRFFTWKQALFLISSTVAALKCIKRSRRPGYLKAGC